MCKRSGHIGHEIACLLASSQDLAARRAFYARTENLSPDCDFAEPLHALMLADLESLAIKAEQDLAAWRNAGISICSYFAEEYPEALRHIEDPPLILFSRGAPLLTWSETRSFAIVGSRRADLPGCRSAERFAKRISSAGVSIISGLALGIDTAAHRGSLESTSALPTIAILGSGLEILYPPQNKSLAEHILEAGGALLSQFTPTTPPYPSNFLNRNRLIAGLSRGVLVIQATARSGALATARYAMEQGKDVFVQPGSVDDPRYEGSLRLIQDGAHLVVSEEDILTLYSDWKVRKEKPTPASRLSDLQRFILKVIEEEPGIPLDVLRKQVGHTQRIDSELLTLELEGAILRLPGNLLRLTR